MRYFELYVNNSYTACIFADKVTIKAFDYGYHIHFQRENDSSIGFWHSSKGIRVEEYKRTVKIASWEAAGTETFFPAPAEAAPAEGEKVSATK